MLKTLLPVLILAFVASQAQANKVGDKEECIAMHKKFHVMPIEELESLYNLSREKEKPKDKELRKLWKSVKFGYKPLHWVIKAEYESRLEFAEAMEEWNYPVIEKKVISDNFDETVSYRSEMNGARKPSISIEFDKAGSWKDNKACPFRYSYPHKNDFYKEFRQHSFYCATKLGCIRPKAPTPFEMPGISVKLNKEKGKFFYGAGQGFFSFGCDRKTKTCTKPQYYLIRVVNLVTSDYSSQSDLYYSMNRSMSKTFGELQTSLPVKDHIGNKLEAHYSFQFSVEQLKQLYENNADEVIKTYAEGNKEQDFITTIPKELIRSFYEAIKEEVAELNI